MTHTAEKEQVLEEKGNSARTRERVCPWRGRSDTFLDIRERKTTEVDLSPHADLEIHAWRWLHSEVRLLAERWEGQ